MARPGHFRPMTPLEQSLRRLCASLDQAALEALANKGLVRRAMKDLERGATVHLSESDDTALRLTVETCTVTMPAAGPAAARCDCGAAGICQHIIAACLWLQTGGAQAILTFDPAEWLAFDEVALRRHAGKATLLAALTLAGSAEPDESGRVMFPVQNIEVRLVRGAGLEGIIVSGQPKDPVRFALAAVLAVQRRAGVTLTLPEEMTTLTESSGAPRTRAEVLASVRGLMEELTGAGLARLPADAEERFATLSVSAVGLDLPRLSLALRGLGDECRLLHDKHARADMGRLLSGMARTYALAIALERSPARPELTGTHRTVYEEAGNLDLMGAGAWPWRTASGYTGITVLFLDLKSGRWNSWTDARPLTQLAGFTHAGSFFGPAPWDGAASPAELAGSRFRLMKARRNAAGRLSSTSQSRVIITGPADFGNASLRIIADWAQLPGLLNESLPSGLSPGNPLTAAAVIRPASWGPRRFDSVRQQFQWLVTDSRGAVLTIQADYDDLTDPMIKSLESLNPEACGGATLTGMVVRTANGIAFSPRSLFLDGKLRHLMFASASAPTLPTQPAAPDNFGEFTEEEPGRIDSGVLEPVLLRVDDLLLRSAESGASSAGRLLPLVASAAGQLRRTGLVSLAAAMPSGTSDWPARLLRAAYLAELHSG